MNKYRYYGENWVCDECLKIIKYPNEVCNKCMKKWGGW